MAIKNQNKTDESPVATKKQKVEQRSDAEKYFNTWGVPYGVDGVYKLPVIPKGSDELHELAGEYDVIFYVSQWFGQRKEENEDICRTARGTATLSITNVDGKSALTGNFEIVATGVDGTDEWPHLGKHLSGQFIENVGAGENGFDFFMPRKIPDEGTIVDGMRKSNALDDDDEEAMDEFFDAWKLRRHGCMKKVTKAFEAEIKPDKLTGLDFKPKRKNLLKELKPTPPKTFTFQEGDLVLQFEEFCVVAFDGDAEAETSKQIFLRRRKESN